MTLDLTQIKEALAKVQDSLAIYKALAEVGDALTIAGNLEATRIALEPKVELLKAEVAGLEDRKADLLKEWDSEQEDLALGREENKKTVSEELQTMRLEAGIEVARLKEELIEKIGELAETKKTMDLEVAELSARKTSLEKELERKNAELDAAKESLEETSAKVAVLKTQLAAIAGKL